MDWFWYAFASAVFISIETIFEKRILKKEHAMQFSAVLAISIFLISLVFLPYLSFQNINFNTLLLLYLNSWFATISFLLVSKAIRHMEVSTVTPFLSFGPVFIVIFSLLFLNETITKIQIFSISLVIFGAYVLQSRGHDYLAPVKEIAKSKYIHYIFIAVVLTAFSSTLDR